MVAVSPASPSGGNGFGTTSSQGTAYYNPYQQKQDRGLAQQDVVYSNPGEQINNYNNPNAAGPGAR